VNAQHFVKRIMQYCARVTEFAARCFQPRNDNTLSVLALTCAGQQPLGEVCAADLDVIDGRSGTRIMRFALPNMTRPHEEFIDAHWSPAGDFAIVDGRFLLDAANGAVYLLGGFAQWPRQVSRW
jgi:hypothetical protein